MRYIGKSIRILMLIAMLLLLGSCSIVHGEELDEEDIVEDLRPVRYMQPMIVDEKGQVIQEYVVEYEDMPKLRAAVKKTTMTGIYYKAYNSKTGWTYYGQMARLSVGGQLAYCLDPSVELNTAAAYKSEGLETFLTNATTRKKIERYANYGYSYQGHQTNKYYCAAQELIWEALSSNWSVTFTTTFNGNTGVSVTSQKNAIKKLVDEHDILPDFADTDIHLTTGQPYTIQDGNGVLDRYTILCQDDRVQVNQTGNELTLTAHAVISSPITLSIGQGVAPLPVNLVYRASGSQTVTVVKGCDTVTGSFRMTADYPYGDLKVAKQDTDGRYVSDMSFRLSYQKDMSDPIGSYTTGSDGTVLIPDLIAEQPIYIQEVAAPTGLVLDPVVYSTTVQEDEVVTYTAVNEFDRGKLAFLKTGPAFTKTVMEETPYGPMIKPIFEEVPLANTTISIYAAEDIRVGDTVMHHKDEIIQTLTGGMRVMESMPLYAGKYYYIERIAPQGYVKDEQKHPFTIEEDGVVDTYVANSTLVNALPTVELAFTKHMEESDIPIQDVYQSVVFGVYSRSAILNAEMQEAIPTNTLVALLHVDDKGHIVDTPRLPEGEYYLKEVATHPGYALHEQEYDFTIVFNGEKEKIMIGEGIVIENRLQEYSIQVNKVDGGTGNPIVSSSFGFSRYADEDCTVELEEAVIDETQGSATFHHIRYGVSYIKETKAPKGYRLSNEVVKVEAKKDGVYINDVLQQANHGTYAFVYENRAIGKLSFLKTGPAFTKAEIEDTPYGPMAKPIFEEIQLTNATISIYAAEDIQVGDTVMHHKDEVIQTLTCGKGGIESKPLYAGKYYYIEEIAPQGYVKDEQRHYFTIKENGGTDTYVVNSTLVNALPTIELAFTKHMEESDVPINNAYQEVVFGIYSRSAILNVEQQEIMSANTLVALLHVDDKGHIVDAPRLPEGNYYLKELKTHPGYISDQQEYDFTIDFADGDKKIVIGEEVVIENYLKEYSIRVNKVDGKSGEPIVTSTFGFSRYADERCTVMLDKAVIDEKQGTATFNHIHYGISYIKETRAPVGYQLSGEIVKIEVKEDGVYINDVLQQADDGSYSFVYLNMMVPRTGDHSDLIIWYILCGMALVGMVAMVKTKNRIE